MVCGSRQPWVRQNHAKFWFALSCPFTFTQWSPEDYESMTSKITVVCIINCSSVFKAGCDGCQQWSRCQIWVGWLKRPLKGPAGWGRSSERCSGHGVSTAATASCHILLAHKKTAVDLQTTVKQTQSTGFSRCMHDGISLSKQKSRVSNLRPHGKIANCLRSFPPCGVRVESIGIGNSGFS